MKARSQFTKGKEFGHRNISSTIINDTNDQIGDYGQFGNASENHSSKGRMSFKQTEQEVLNSPERMGASIDFMDQDNHAFSEEASQRSFEKQVEVNQPHSKSNHTLPERIQIINDMDAYSDQEVESYLFGKSGDSDNDKPARIEKMDNVEIAKYIFGYIKIKSK